MLIIYNCSIIIYLQTDSIKMSFSKREIEEFRPKVDRVVEKFLGFHEPALVETALHCLGAGYDKKKTTG